MITENLQTLKIHKLTQAQYDRELSAGHLDENALYLTPDEPVVIDETLSISGAAADAKAVGDIIANLSDSGDSDIYIQNEEPIDVPDGALWVDLDEDGNVEQSINLDSSLTLDGYAADAKAVGDAILSAMNSLREEILGGKW